MTSSLRLSLGVSLLAIAMAQGTSAVAPQTRAAGQGNPPAAFTDPARREKLAAAFPEIDRAVAAFMERTHVPGAAWGIVIDGELAHLGVAGFRELPSKSPVTRDSVFRIASMTKSFTAMAVMKLRDEGKLSLDDLAEKHVPELKALRYPTSDSPRITVRDLMSHAAGFPEDNPWGDQQLAASEAEFTKMLQQGIPFSNTPGVAYSPSSPRAMRSKRRATTVGDMPRWASKLAMRSI
jgi:CubicO group peptidase (beta-lactamase class C family)